VKYYTFELAIYSDSTNYIHDKTFFYTAEMDAMSSIQEKRVAGYQLLKSLILTTQEADMRRIVDHI
jgi:hypothetical protein